MSAIEMPYRTTVSARAEEAGRPAAVANAIAASSIRFRVRMNRAPLDQYWQPTCKLDARLGSWPFLRALPPRSCTLTTIRRACGSANTIGTAVAYHCIRNNHEIREGVLAMLIERSGMARAAVTAAVVLATVT